MNTLTQSKTEYLTECLLEVVNNEWRVAAISQRGTSIAERGPSHSCVSGPAALGFVFSRNHWSSEAVGIGHWPQGSSTYHCLNNA